MLNYLILIFIALCASLLMTPLVRDLALRLGAVDKPGGRKVHVVAVPRLGGISVFLAICLTMLAAVGLQRMNPGFTFDIEGWVPVFLGATVVFLVGVWDDLRPVPPRVKILSQALAAAIAIWAGIRIEYLSALGGGVFELGVLAIPLTFLWIVGLTNAFNLIDGLDGLATGLGVIAAATSATIFFMGGGVSDSLLLAILAGALIGFLRYNFHPASIFLGDSGSQFIGYVLAVTAITGSQKAATTLPVIIPLLVLGLPIFDTLLSMTRRVFKGRRSRHFRQVTLRDWIVTATRIFQADRDHVHHRLLTMGFSHRSAVLMLYGIAATLSLLALMSVSVQYRNAGAILLTVIVVMYIGFRRLGYEEIVFVRAATVLRWCERIMFMRLVSQAMVDLALIAIAYWTAFLLKYDGVWTPEVTNWFLLAFPFVLVIQMVVFFGLGLYEGVWRAMGIADLLHLGLAAGIGVLLSYVIAVIYAPPSGVLSFFAIDGLLLLVLLLSGHSAYRVLVHVGRRDSVNERVPVLIYGAGRRGEFILHELMENRRLGLRPIGFLDDDPRLRGTTINRVRILGSGGDLSSIMRSRKVSALIVSSHKISAEQLRPVISLCSEQRIPIMRGEFQLDRLSAITSSAARLVMSSH